MPVRFRFACVTIMAAMLLPVLPVQGQEAVNVPVRPVHQTPLPDEASKPLMSMPVPPEAGAIQQSLSVAAVKPADASPLAPVRRSDDDLVLVDVVADGTTLMQTVPGYVNKNALVLPLGQITEALEFPIKVSVKEGIADGWFYREDNRFALDVARHDVTVGGNRQDYDPKLVEVHDDDIFVDRTLLEKWFALKIDFAFSSQTVKIAAAGPDKLPIALAGELAQRKEKLGSRLQAEAKNYPAVREPYALYSMPFMNVSITGGYDGGSTDKPLTGSANIVSTGDLLYMNSEFYSNYDQTGDIGNWRMSLSRRDPEGELFASDEMMRHTWVGETFHDLKVNDFTVGDVFTPELPLTAKSANGLGGYVSNQPFDRATQFDRTTLEGNILPNWDVELYRNDELLAFQRAGADGRYTFTGVPLISGLNIMRLVFHGPYAETREEIRRIMVSSDIAKAGKSYFRMGVMEQEKDLSSLIPLPGKTTGTSASLSGFSTQTGLRSFFDYEYGVLDNLSLFAQLVNMPTDDGRQQSYATTGVGTSLFGIYGRVDGSYGSLGGQAVQAQAQTNLWGVSLAAKHQIFQHFLSDYSENATDPLKKYSEVRADSPLNLSWLPRLNLGISGDRAEYQSGLKRDEVTQRTSSSFGRVAVTNSLSLQQDTSGDDSSGVSSSSQTVGDLTLSVPLWEVLVRGGAQYDITPGFALESVALAADKALGQNLNLRGEVTHDMANDRLTTFAIGLNKSFQQFQIGLNSSYDTENRAAAFINLTFSFGREPRTDSWHFFADQTAREGIITARTYLDKNDDGVFDTGDEPVAKVNIRSDGGGTATTDENGVALLLGQRTTAKNNVSVDEGTIGNPSWVVKNEGFGVITRPGTPAHVDFAIVDSGVIDGTVYLMKADGTKTIASNVVMQLVDDQGKVAHETRSSFDGYYIFERVLRGHYALRVSPEQLARRSLKSSDPVDVEIKGEESSLSGLDFVLSAS